MYQFAKTTRKSIADLSQRISLCKLAEQHAYKLRPATETARMSLALIPFDNTSELLYHDMVLRIGVGLLFLEKIIFQYLRRTFKLSKIKT